MLAKVQGRLPVWAATSLHDIVLESFGVVTSVLWRCYFIASALVLLYTSVRGAGANKADLEARNVFSRLKGAFFVQKTAFFIRVFKTLHNFAKFCSV